MTKLMTAHDVAAAIIGEAAEIDALRLQKLVFLAAGEYLALTGQAMFPEPIEAWDYGPVVHSLYKTYQNCEAKPIIAPKKGDPARLNDVAMACVESVVARFGHMTGSDLISLTHGMAPWRKAYVLGRFRTAIDLQEIYEYFAQAPTTEQAAGAIVAWQGVGSDARDDQNRPVRFVLA